MSWTRLATTALLAALAALPALPVSAQQVEERIDRTIPFRPGGTLRLKTFSGKVDIRGTGGNDVVIHAVRRAEPDKLRDIRFDIQSGDGTITINANENDGRRRNENVVETDIEILVPMQTRLDVKSFSAPVTVREVEGTADLDTFSGKVVVDATTWPDGQDLEVNTFSGDIELNLPDGARGDFAFNTFSGDLTTDLPLTLSSARGRRDVRGALNGGGAGHLRLKTFSGDATVRE